jgi:RHS repeat-associated protein
MVSGAEEWRYAYTADDERAWLFKVGGNLSRWTLRDLGNKVLREYLNDGGVWSVASDYVYRDGQLLAAETSTGPRHFHLDHLGTPRLITDRAGRQAAYHVYFPFGEEATAFNQDAERMKFTGHERDLASLAGAGDDLDSMHARHCSPLTGRFLSMDPADSAHRLHPQSLNRYVYALNNPVRFHDTNGLDEREGAAAGVIINGTANERIWIAADVGDETLVIPLEPGERSDTYVRDADAVVIDPGVVTTQGAQLEPAIEGEASGAFKIGISEVTVMDSGALDLRLDRSPGYFASFLLGRAGYLSPDEARKEKWLIPENRPAAESRKEELRKQQEERERARSAQNGSASK